MHPVLLNGEGDGARIDEVDLGGNSSEYRYADAAGAEGAAAAPPSPHAGGSSAVARRRNILSEISPSGVRCARLTLGFAACIAAGMLTGTTNVPVEFTAKTDEFRLIYTCAFAGSVVVFNCTLVALLALFGVAQVSLFLFLLTADIFCAADNWTRSPHIFEFF